jgi:hypothetical protein
MHLVDTEDAERGLTDRVTSRAHTRKRVKAVIAAEALTTAQNRTMANLVARYVRQVLVAGAAVTALAGSPALAAPSPVLTLVCKVSEMGTTGRPPAKYHQDLVEIWNDGGTLKLTLSRHDPLYAKITASYITFESVTSNIHATGVIDRTTGSFNMQIATSVGLTMFSTGQCS